MHLKRQCLAAFLVVLATSFAVAQSPGNPPPNERPAREERPREMRPGPGIGRAAPPEMQLEHLKEQLKLDEAQSVAVRKLIDEHHAKVMAARDEFRPTPEESETMNRLRKAMEEARQSDDPTRIDELREEARKIRTEREAKLQPIREQLEQSEKNLHDGVFQLLRPDQQEDFEKVWAERAASGFNRGGAGRDPRMLKAIIDRIPDLTGEQKSQIEKLFEEFRRPPEKPSDSDREDGSRPARPTREDRMKLQREKLEKLHADVMAVLTPDQQKSVEAELKKLEDRRPDRRERGRGGRGGRLRGDDSDRGGRGRPASEDSESD
ncbi:MAG: hypothetical protein KF841_12135 [Phycisphaerae bacterium]|nr:hypothetical protein [Phycisphaerae bacterium]